MARKRGKFIDKSSTVTSDDQVGMLSVPGAEVVEVEQESWFSIILGWSKSIIGFVLLLIVVLALLFTGLGTSILTFTPLNPDNALQREIVLRGAWAETGGQPPLETVVAVSHSAPAPTAENWWNWAPIAWVGIENPSKVTIVSTDHDEIVIGGTKEDAWVVNKSSVTTDDKPIEGELVSSAGHSFQSFDEGADVSDSFKLKNAYLVKCISGSCEPGTFFIIPETYIYGEVR